MSITGYVRLYGILQRTVGPLTWVYKATLGYIELNVRLYGALFKWLYKAIQGYIVVAYEGLYRAIQGLKMAISGNRRPYWTLCRAICMNLENTYAAVMSNVLSIRCFFLKEFVYKN